LKKFVSVFGLNQSFWTFLRMINWFFSSLYKNRIEIFVFRSYWEDFYVKNQSKWSITFSYHVRRVIFTISSIQINQKSITNCYFMILVSWIVSFSSFWWNLMTFWIEIGYKSFQINWFLFFVICVYVFLNQYRWSIQTWDKVDSNFQLFSIFLIIFNLRRLKTITSSTITSIIIVLLILQVQAVIEQVSQKTMRRLMRVLRRFWSKWFHKKVRFDRTYCIYYYPSKPIVVRESIISIYSV